MAFFNGVFFALPKNKIKFVDRATNQLKYFIPIAVPFALERPFIHTPTV
jgi:hypothetical protein